MKEISIERILESMNEEKNYADSIWRTCLNEKRKRYKMKEIVNSLKKLEALGFVKKNKISKDETHYSKISYSNSEDYIGFVNNVMFSNESKIKETLRKLENKKIFVDISKDLSSYKLGNKIKIDYNEFLNAFSSMMDLASSVQLIIRSSNSEKLKNQLNQVCQEIKAISEQTNHKISKDRKSNEIILLQRHFAGRIPVPGHLKLS